MLTDVELAEYADEIRKEVCSRCIERPPGGPPCAPLGKQCGVELHLAALIDSIHGVQDSEMLAPYLEHNRHGICENCAFLHSSICPCPMDYLAALIVEAVQTVDEKRRQRGQEPLDTHRPAEVKLEEIRRIYLEALGTWQGCDWPIFFGKTNLELSGWTSAQARSMAQETLDPDAVEDWKRASAWLGQVEDSARRAEANATEALLAAERGDWQKARTYAEWAWALEFATGRPLRRGFPLTWQRLREAIESVPLGCEVAAASSMYGHNEAWLCSHPAKPHGGQ